MDNQNQARSPATKIINVVVLVFCVIAVASSCRRFDKIERIGPLKDANESSPMFAAAPVSSCSDRPIKPRRGKVQVLIDSSGSLIGFQQIVSPLFNWVRHGISQLQGASLEVTSSSLCQFSEGLGIFGCTEASNGLTHYVPATDTNLDSAIRFSKDNELTFILTDGVAASGAKGSKQCAGGVDSSCVAHALVDALHPDIVGGVDTDRGVWIIPLAGIYDGKFYTEEPILPSDFKPAETIKMIRSDIGFDATIQDPRAGLDGKLTYGYRGPRAMILIVIAKSTDVGRAAVESLWNHAGEVGIAQLKQFAGFNSGIGILSPIEVYPGFLNSVEWQKLDPPSQPSDMRGTIDVTFDRSEGRPKVGISCPPNGSGEGIYTLSGISRTDTRTAGCAPITVLSPFILQVRTARDEDAGIWSSFIRGFEHTGTGLSDLRLHLTCSNETNRPCKGNPLHGQWIAFMKYDKAADCLASEGCTGYGEKIVKGLSTIHPSLEPHRIYSFAETLRTFYELVSKDQRSFVLTNFDICRD